MLARRRDDYRDGYRGDDCYGRDGCYRGGLVNRIVGDVIGRRLLDWVEYRDEPRSGFGIDNTPYQPNKTLAWATFAEHQILHVLGHWTSSLVLSINIHCRFCITSRLHFHKPERRMRSTLLTC